MLESDADTVKVGASATAHTAAAVRIGKTGITICPQQTFTSDPNKRSTCRVDILILASSIESPEKDTIDKIIHKIGLWKVDIRAPGIR
jgi:hypothetical protein